MAQTKISHHLDRHLMRLATTLELSKTIVEVTETKDVLGMLMDLCLQLTYAETALFILKNGMYEIKGERCVIRGLNNKEISKELYISIHTVKNHLTHIFNKLGVTDRAETIAFIYRLCYGQEL